MTPPADESPRAAPKLEIERKYLLRAMPALLRFDETWIIEQGYLKPLADAGPSDDLPEGRLRRITHEDGRIEHIWTVKRGSGLVREETETLIDAERFARAWPRTAKARLAKTRHRLREGDLIWEIDFFHDVDLVLAEVELPAPDHPVIIPGWLEPVLAREVTNDPDYGNFSLALRICADRARG